jgi:hypothetical protein
MPLFSMQDNGVLIDPDFCELTEEVLEMVSNLLAVKEMAAKNSQMTETAFVQLLLLNAAIVGQP